MAERQVEGEGASQEREKRKIVYKILNYTIIFLRLMGFITNYDEKNETIDSKFINPKEK